MATRPTDPLFPFQWYLFNNGTNSNAGTNGLDINLIDDDPNTIDIWDSYTGKGINVGIIDDGIESNHEDLRANYNTLVPNLTPTYNPAEGQPQENEGHGTSVAGIIAGEKNDIGVVGIAYDAKITGFKFSNITTDDVSTLNRQVAFDVSSNSWAYTIPFPFPQQNEAQRISETLKNVATNGRNNLGTAFVFAGGNDRQLINSNFYPNPEIPGTEENFRNDRDVAQKGNNVNYSILANSRYVIAVAAVEADGVFAPYSNPGAALLISAFGDDPGTIVTTDRTGNNGYNGSQNDNNLNNLNYTNGFNGTSSATPMVSGVVALMLQANPSLGYRDVQEILAYSAYQNDPNAQRYNPENVDPNKLNSDAWTFNGASNWNGGGLHINHDYGYGLVDAHAAVRLAETWQLQSTAADANVGAREQVVSSPALLLPNEGLIPDNEPNGINRTFTIASGLQIDHVELELDIEHGQFQDLIVTLTSPNGTESILLDRVPYTSEFDPPDTSIGLPVAPPNDKGFKGTTLKYTFSSTRHWGELGAGTWTLNISDNNELNEILNTGQAIINPDNTTTVTAGNNVGQLNSATLRLYGDPITNDNTFIYTDEFANFTNDTVRRTLTDPNNTGTDTINAATIRSNSIINLTPGSTSTLAGNTLSINQNTNIENAFGGDGNDQITGTDGNNELRGGRGNDTIEARGGNDILDGGGGADNLFGGLGDDTYRLMAASGGSRIRDDGGIDALLLANLTLALAAPTVGRAGLTRQDDTLLIDLNQDGTINLVNDLSIQQFFASTTNTAGTGFIENVANLAGGDILNSAIFGPPSTLTVTNNIFSFDGGTGAAKLQATLRGVDGKAVNEVGVFAVNNDQGTIIDPITGNSVTPENPDYARVALSQGKAIFSVLPDRLGGDNNTRIIEGFDGSDRLAFYFVANSTTDNVLAGQTAPTDVIFGSNFGAAGGFQQMQVNNLGNNEFTLSWEDQVSGGDRDFNDLLLNVKLTSADSLLGTPLQGQQQGELLDLRNPSLQGRQLSANFVLNREANFNNTVGFYKIVDASGSIDQNNDGTIDFRPGDAGYAQAAIQQRVDNINLTVGNKATATISSQLLGGSLFAPFLVSQGSAEQFLNQNPNNQSGQDSLAYFAFLGANPDKVDHIRLLGDNTFGFEDLFGGGDKDFNDVVVRVNFA